MGTKTTRPLASTGYRCLFECVKQQGIDQMLHLIQSINNISSYGMDTLLNQAIINGKNDLIALVKRNSDIIKYLREHKKDLQRLDLANENVLNTLNSLSNDISLLELYLDNAKRLEELKVEQIRFENFPFYSTYECGIYRNDQGKIIIINKYYTDGKIQSVNQEYEVDKLFHYSRIPFSIDNENTSFVLNINNDENGYQYRAIEITDFGFDRSKLPTEKEMQSYEIPKYLIKKKNN